MTSFNDRLYNLIPAIYRIRDEESDGPLRALLSVISQEVDVVERDIEQLYDNWFIETCDEWVVPYIGELVGHKAVVPTNGEITDPHVQARNRWLFPRREIANIVQYRRRKGTLPVLEEIAFDTAGWHSLAVEFWKQVAATPDLRYGSLNSAPKLPNFRDPDWRDHFGGPFNTVGHTVNFREQMLAEQRQRQRGQEVPNRRTAALPIAPKSIGLWVWRNEVYSTTGVTPGGDVHCDVRFFTFHPLGMDVPLYHRPQRAKNPEAPALEHELPIQISRTLLGEGKHQRPNPLYYGAGRSLVVRIKASQAETVGLPAQSGDHFVEVPTWKVRVTELSQAVLPFLKANDQWFPDECEALLDPELGRFVLKQHLMAPVCEMSIQTNDLQVTFHTAFGGDLGGGEYHCPHDPQRRMPTWIISPERDPVRVSERCPIGTPANSDPNNKRTTIDKAMDLVAQRLDQLREQRGDADDRHLVLELSETGVYQLTKELCLNLPRNCTLEIRAAARACPYVKALDSGKCQALPLRFQLHPGAKVILDGVIVATEGLCVTHVPPSHAVTPHTDCQGCQSNNQSCEDAQLLPEPSRVVLRHSTLVPRMTQECCHNAAEPSRVGRLVIGQGIGEVCLDHAITGPIETTLCEQKCCGGCEQGEECHGGCGGGRYCPPPATRLRVLDSVVDGQQSMGVREEWHLSGLSTSREVSAAFESLMQGQFKDAARHAIKMVGDTLKEVTSVPLILEARRSTFLGTVFVQTIELIENCLCRDQVLCDRRQRGMLRFSYVPGDAANQPVRLRCLPDDSKEPVKLADSDFASLTYGDAGYCQLRRSAPAKVRQGADDGGEMGVFHDQFIPHRELALERRLTEFTPATHTLTILYADEYRANLPVEDK